MDVSGHSEIHASSENSRVSYLSVNGRRRTTDFRNNLLQQIEEKAKRRLERLQWSFELEKQKFEKEVEDANISFCAKNLKTSSDNLSVFSIESSLKDFSLSHSFEYPIKTIPKVTSKSKSTSLKETYIKNICDTPSNPQHVLLKKFTIFLKVKFLKKLRYGVIFFFDHSLSKNIERAYDAEHTARSDRKVSSQIYRFFL